MVGALDDDEVVDSEWETEDDRDPPSLTVGPDGVMVSEREAGAAVALPETELVGSNVNDRLMECEASRVLVGCREREGEGVPVRDADTDRSPSEMEWDDDVLDVPEAEGV